MFGFVRKAKFDEHTEKFDQYVEKLELELSNAKKRIGELEETVNWRSSLFFKAFAVAGLKGDYLEFGVFRGATLSDAFWCARRHADLFLGGAWDHSMADAVREKAIFQRDYEAMRFIGFDSFEGLPAISGVDVLFVGPADLTLGLGKFGKTDDPEVRAILEKVVAACERHGKVAAIPCAPEQVKSYHAMGFRFFNVISDFRCVSTGMKAARAAVEI